MCGLIVWPLASYLADSQVMSLGLRAHFSPAGWQVVVQADLPGAVPVRARLLGVTRSLSDLEFTEGGDSYVRLHMTL